MARIASQVVLAPGGRREPACACALKRVLGIYCHFASPTLIQFDNGGAAENVILRTLPACTQCKVCNSPSRRLHLRSPSIHNFSCLFGFTSLRVIAPPRLLDFMSCSVDLEVMPHSTTS